MLSPNIDGNVLDADYSDSTNLDCHWYLTVLIHPEPWLIVLESASNAVSVLPSNVCCSDGNKTSSNNACWIVLHILLLISFNNGKGFKLYARDTTIPLQARSSPCRNFSLDLEGKFTSKLFVHYLRDKKAPIDWLSETPQIIRRANKVL